jgi:hypothetical protein
VGKLEQRKLVHVTKAKAQVARDVERHEPGDAPAETTGTASTQASKTDKAKEKGPR